MDLLEAQNKNDFYSQIYAVVALIPKGRVTSYGAIANALGRQGAARQVGYAMNKCHIDHPELPAHRVVNRNGLLTGKHHFGTEHQMEELLQKEGIIVVNDAIQNFSSIFWDPIEELG